MGKESELTILEIYHPSISAGDTAIIVTRNSDNSPINCVLIDLGCNTSEIINWCIANITGFAEIKKSTFDYVIVSHYHTDHYYGINNASIKTDKLINSYVTDPKLISQLGRDYSQENNDATKPKLLSKLKSNSQVNIFDVLSPCISDDGTPKKMEEKDMPKPIDLGTKENKNLITLTCICANGIYKDKKGIFNGHPGNFKDWNDHSIAWLLEYKGTEENFIYYTAGDLSGSNSDNYTDIESQLIPYLADKKVNVLKATHHGSKHSLSQNFLNTIKPDNIIVPSNNGYLLPFPAFFNRVQDLITQEIAYPKIFICNYLNFDKLKYKGKGEGLEDLLKLKDNGHIFPKINIDEKVYTAIKDEYSHATLPCFLTTVKGTGKSETKATKPIRLKITAPSFGEENLPSISLNKEFAEAFFDAVSKQIGNTTLKFSDVYTKNSSLNHYEPNKYLDIETRKSFLSGFKEVFPPSTPDKEKGININMLVDPISENTTNKRSLRNEHPDITYLDKRLKNKRKPLKAGAKITLENLREKMRKINRDMREKLKKQQKLE